jgi:arylsulfatase A
MVEDMDRIVGNITAALDRLGLREKTAILFTTDNGSPARYLTRVEHQGGKLRRHHQPVISQMGDKDVPGGKGQMTDAGTRVPLVANWPGTTPGGRVCGDLIDFSDLLPTLAELARVSLPEDESLDGRSFAPQLRGQVGSPRRWVFCEHRGRQWVRTTRWKLYSDNRLIDMQNDPDERNPVPIDSEPPTAAAARTMLQAVLRGLQPEPD